MNRNGKFGMSGNREKAKVVVICAVAALLGGTIAAAVTGAQGPGNYQPSTTTTTVTGGTTTVTSSTPTTTLGDGTGDKNLRLSLKGTKGKQKLPGPIKVKASCVVESCFVAAHGKFVIRKRTTGIDDPNPNRVRHAKATRYRLDNDVASLGIAETTTLTLKLPKKGAKKAMREVPRKDTKAIARVIVDANDDAGNTKEKKRRIKLKP